MPRLKRVFWTLLALAFLGVSWLWERLHPIVYRILNAIPLEGVKRAARRFMERLPPYPTLVFFLLPVVILEPMKLVAVWFFARGQFLLGVVTYAGTDVARLGLVSFLFNISKDKLLSIPWFARLYVLFRRIHEWAHAQVAPFKAAVRRAFWEAGFGDSRRVGTWSKVLALWRHARRGGFKGA